MRDPLYVGPTRPSMAWGIPFEAWLAILLISAFAFLATGNLLCGLLAFPLYGVSWVICLNDPRGFELALKWLETKGASISRRKFGAASRSPLASRNDLKKALKK